MLLEYDGYKLSTNWYNMSDDEKTVIVACVCMVRYKLTIRTTAMMFSYATTTFWKRIHNECKELSPDLYRCVVKQMKKNLERGQKNYGK